MRKWILPGGLVAALVLGMTVPGPGIRLGDSKLALVMIGMIFFINGYQTHHSALVVSRRLAGAFVLSAVVAFGGGSLLGSLAARLPVFDTQIALGILVMSIMAPTLSSVIVITRESKGNTVWATLLTMAINCLGVFVIPPLLSWLVKEREIALPATALFRDLVLSVVVPFCLGLLLRRWLQKKPSGLVNLTPTLLIILLSYVSFSGGRETVLQSGLDLVGWIVAVVLGIHLGLLGAAFAAGKALGFEEGERKAIAFLSSQKTLPTAVGVMAALGYAGGAALLPCVVFHFCQILADSLIAIRWRGKPTAEEDKSK